MLTEQKLWRLLSISLSCFFHMSKAIVENSGDNPVENIIVEKLKKTGLDGQNL